MAARRWAVRDGWRRRVPWAAVPELPEVEAYRRLAGEAVGRTVTAVDIGDPRFVRGATTPAALVRRLPGRLVVGARRRGKLLVLDLAPPRRATAAEPLRLGLRFGMTGRLLVDGHGPIDRLLYSSERHEAAWDRFGLHFTGGGTMVVRDPRLLGGVILDPDEDALGPDAAGLTLAQLAAALDGSAAPLKARLLDQAKVAGIGNLVADELLWRAGIAPGRRAGSLDGEERRRLHRHLRATVRMLVQRGGSHTGDLMPARVPGGRCPRDGAELCRSTVGGRTSWWCPAHQH